MHARRREVVQERHALCRVQRKEPPPVPRQRLRGVGQDVREATALHELSDEEGHVVVNARSVEEYDVAVPGTGAQARQQNTTLRCLITQEARIGTHTPYITSVMDDTNNSRGGIQDPHITTTMNDTYSSRSTQTHTSRPR